MQWALITLGPLPVYGNDFIPFLKQILVYDRHLGLFAVEFSEIFRHMTFVLAHLGLLWDQFGMTLGPLWGHFGLTWLHFGVTLSQFGAILGE